MKTLDIGLITSRQEIFDKFVGLNRENNVTFWRISDRQTVSCYRFDVILKIDFWQEVSEDTIQRAYTRLKK
jgi:hypothetical protein